MRKITENKLEENEIKEKIAKEMGINLASNCQRVESTTYDLDKFIGVTKRTYDKVSRGEREIALDEILLLEEYFNAPCDSFLKKSNGIELDERHRLVVKMLKEDKQIGTGMVNHKKLKAEIYQKISDIIDGNNIKDNSSRDDSDYLVDRFGKRSVPNIIDIYIVSEVYDIKMHGILMTEEGEKFKRLIQTQKKEICENLAKWFTEQSKQS